MDKETLQRIEDIIYGVPQRKYAISQVTRITPDVHAENMRDDIFYALTEEFK